MESHLVLYPNPTPSQLALVGSTINVGDLRREFSLLYDILVLNTRGCWDEWDADERRGALTPEEYVASSVDTVTIVSIDSTMASAFLAEDYVQPIPGHLALFMEHTGFANVTLVFTEEGLIG